MIENVTKSIRRKQTVDEAYMENLYKDMTSLYRLDQIAGVNGREAGKADLGKLPDTAIYLLSAIAGAWILMALYVLYQWQKKKKITNKGKL